jgi:hypothetical protein
LVSHWIGDQKAPSCFGRQLSRWSRLYLQLLAPTNSHWVRVVGYGPYTLCVIHKEHMCPSSGGINKLIIMMMSSMVERSVRSACNRGSQAPVSMANLRMGDQNLLSRAPPCFGRHVKPLVPVAFAIVSIHSSFKEG